MNEPQKFLMEAVKSNDIRKIRNALSSYLTKNPRNDRDEVTNAVEYVREYFDDSVIWQEQDNRPLEEDETKWTEDYLAYLQSDLRHNFSEKRFRHFIKVGQKVRKKKPNQLAQKKQYSHIQVTRNVINQSNQKLIGVTLAAVGVGIAIALVAMMVKK